MEAVGPLVLRELDTPIVVKEVAGPMVPSDLPLQHVQAASIVPLKHAVDLVAEYVGELDLDVLKSLMSQGKWSELPEPVRPKVPLPEGARCQIAVIPCPGSADKFTIIKHLVFAGRCKVSYILQYVTSDLKKITWEHPKTGIKVWQHFFDRLGGLRASCWHLVPFIPKKKGESVIGTLDDAQIDAGFNLIEAEGPRCVAHTMQLRWTTKQVNGKDSAIYGCTPPKHTRV